MLQLTDPFSELNQNESIVQLIHLSVSRSANQSNKTSLQQPISASLQQSVSNQPITVAKEAVTPTCTTDTRSSNSKTIRPGLASRRTNLDASSWHVVKTLKQPDVAHNEIFSPKSISPHSLPTPPCCQHPPKRKKKLYNVKVN